MASCTVQCFHAKHACKINSKDSKLYKYTPNLFHFISYTCPLTCPGFEDGFVRVNLCVNTLVELTTEHFVW